MPAPPKSEFPSSEGKTLGEIVKAAADQPMVNAHYDDDAGVVRQYGGVPYSDDYRKVTYNDKAGTDALKFYTDLQTQEKVGQMGVE